MPILDKGQLTTTNLEPFSLYTKDSVYVTSVGMFDDRKAV
jgi:hypothetical protein